MASKQECFDAVRAEFAKKSESDPSFKFSEAEIRSIVDEIRNVRSRIFEQGRPLAGAEFREKVMNLLNERRYRQAAERREFVENLTKRYKNVSYATQEAFANDPVEAVRGLLVGGTTRLSKGGNLSVAASANAQHAEWIHNLFHGLKEKGLDEVVQKGLLDREIAVELGEMRKGGKEGLGGSKEALDAAKVIKSVNDQVLRAKQLSGSSVRALDGYITRQIHDQAKLKAATMEQWMADTLPLLDQERTFGDFSGDKVHDLMASSYRDILSGSKEGQVGSTFNVGKKLSQARSLHFKDGAAWMEYKKLYGTDKSLLEQIFLDFGRQSKQVALMERLGTNPEQGFIDLKRGLYDAHKSNPALVDSLKQSEKSLQNTFDTVMGFSDAPGTSLLARAGQVARTWQAMSKLGGAVLSSMPDVVNAASMLRSGQGKGLLEAMSGLVPDYLGNFASKAERQKWAGRLNVYLDDLRGEVFSKFGAESAAPGAFSKMQRFYYKINPLGAHVDAAKIATAKQFAMSLADHAGTAFESLPARVKADLERYGFNSSEWSTLGQAVETFEGNSFMTPEGVDSIDASKFGGEKAKRDAKLKLLTYLNDYADIGSTTPGTRQKAFLLQGTPDEGLGILLRTVAQFKAVPLMTLNTAERVLMSNPETRPTSRVEAMKKGDIWGMTQLMVWSTGLGYLSLSAKDAMNGKTPRDPSQLKTWSEAMVRGGSLGLYGDFLLGEFSAVRTPIDALAGPTFSEFGNVLELASKVRAGDVKASEAFRLTMNNVPFANLLYTKGALDHFVLHQVNETLSPGYLRRMESRAREQGQSYFPGMRPTERFR